MQNLDYDKMASTYARHRVANQHILNELRRKWISSPESRVLEVGCGTGLHLRALVERTGCKGWGIDPSREMIHHAIGSDDIHFIEGVAEKLRFETGFFDLVFSVDVIHHIKAMAMRKLLKSSTAQFIESGNALPVRIRQMTLNPFILGVRRVVCETCGMPAN